MDWIMAKGWIRRIVAEMLPDSGGGDGSAVIPAPTEADNGKVLVAQDGGVMWGAGGDVWINLADYGIGLMTSFYDDSGNAKSTVSVSITSEQLTDLIEKMQNPQVRGFYADFLLAQDGVAQYVRCHFQALYCACAPLPLAVCMTYGIKNGSGAHQAEMWRIGSDGDELMVMYCGKADFAE